MNPDPLTPPGWDDLWDVQAKAWVPRRRNLGGLVLVALCSAALAFVVGLFVGANVFAASRSWSQPFPAVAATTGTPSGAAVAPEANRPTDSEGDRDSGVPSSPAALSDPSTPLAAPSPTAGARTARPSATPHSATPRLGTATWYIDPKRSRDGMYAAVHSWRWGMEPYLVQVCSFEGGKTNCVLVAVGDYCLCTGGGYRIIDLSPAAFRSLAPLSRGIVRVQVDGLR